MQRFDGAGRYADLIETIRYNVIAASHCAAGKSVFYVNALHRRPDAAGRGYKAMPHRQCCG